MRFVACQEADGSITIGDSHTYADEADPNRSDETDELICDELSSMITVTNPQPQRKVSGLDECGITPVYALYVRGLTAKLKTSNTERIGRSRVVGYLTVQVGPII